MTSVTRSAPTPKQPEAPPETGALSESSAAPERAIVCAACGHAITHARAAAAIDGAHEHTFVNAHGYVHQLRCFYEAAGCALAGRATLEWTWFAGYAWRFALCGGCGRHVGWRYERGDDSFYGLITTAVTET